jgi:hypothetical protein
MRELFVSERRYIRNILWQRAKILWDTFDPVVLEYYAPPRTRCRVRFNNDYFLRFVAAENLRETKSYGSPVLPNTLGADVFLTVDELTSRPLMTELLAGEAFSIKYFKEHIEKIEDSLARLSHRVQFRKCAYSRVFVIENDICFLAFPEMPAPAMRGNRQPLASGAEGSIVSYVDGTELVCVDGWIRTYVPSSEWKLEAIPIDPEAN